MFCAIQKIHNKKENDGGASKQLLADSYSFSYNGQATKTRYTYKYSLEKFKRPIKTAYKITLHQSYRENGKVKKKQYNICTIDYYSVAEWGLYDYISTSVEKLAKELNVAEEELYDLIYAKYNIIESEVKGEFEQSEEYITHQKHKQIIDDYNKAKSDFAEKYKCSQDEYDYCYNIFGELENKEYLKQVQSNFKAQKEYTRSSYENSKHSNYNSYSYSGYGDLTSSNYNNDETKLLKQFYKKLSMMYHPDMYQNLDTTKQMQLINKLKEQWKL